YGLAAIPVIGQDLGLVTDADLPHFDPRLELASQVLDQLAEIDPLLRQEIKDDPLSPQQRLDVHECHGKLSGLDKSLAGLKRLLTQLLGSQLGTFILRSKGAKYVTVRGLREHAQGGGGCLAEYLPELVATFGPDDDPGAGRVRR